MDYLAGLTQVNEDVVHFELNHARNPTTQIWAISRLADVPPKKKRDSLEHPETK